MMRVTYIGPSAVVFLPMSEQLAERHGDPLEVEDDYGILLCEQTTNWVPADPESQAVLDDFYRWVATHEKRETIVDGELVIRWMPRREEEQQSAEAEPATDPPSPAAPRPRNRQTTASNKES